MYVTELKYSDVIGGSVSVYSNNFIREGFFMTYSIEKESREHDLITLRLFVQ